MTVNPNFLTQKHADLKKQILEDYHTIRPATDAEEAADIDLKADILAGNLKTQQWRQSYIFKQVFSETSDMEYLILTARDYSSIEWDDGVRSQGYIKLSRSSAAGQDYPITAGTVFVSAADSDGNLIRASLLYDVTLKTGETYCIGIAEIIELQAETPVKYEIPASGGGTHTVAAQELGSGAAGNVTDSTLTDFESSPPTGIEDVINFSPGYSQGKANNSSTTFTITASTNDQIKVDIDGAGVQEITLTAGTSMTGETAAADIQTKLRAIGTGGYIDAYCKYNLTETDYRFIIFSGTVGVSSSVAVSPGTNDAAATLGLDDLTEKAGGYGFQGGIDPQSKESLKAEYETAIQEGGEAGTEADYIAWAKDSGQGVDDAKVSRFIGAVAVYPVSGSGVLFTQPQLDAILTYIETKCPVHLINSITVDNPAVLSIYIDASGFVFDSGYDLTGTSAAIKTAIKNYIRTIDIGDGSTINVRYNLVTAAILNVTGIIDVGTLYIDTVDPPTGTANILLADGEVSQTDDTKIDLSA